MAAQRGADRSGFSRDLASAEGNDHCDSVRDNRERFVFPRRRRRFRLGLLTLLLVGAIGLALIIIGLAGTGWLLVAFGSAALLVALPGAYMLLRPGIEEAANAIGRGRRVTLRRDRPMT
jgi:hypothetical protein